MKDITKEYPNKDLNIVWQPKKCIHSENCWRGLPEVFRYKQKPWIDPEGAESEKIIAQIDKCPSGALSYKIKNESLKTREDMSATQVNLAKNGPLMIKGKMEIELPDGTKKEMTNAAFCRCGASGNKPFCDGTHSKVDFQAD